MNFLVSSRSILLIVRTIYSILLRLLSQIPEHEYFAQSLTYYEYCDATDLESDCLISSSVHYGWINSECLPAVLDGLEANLTE